MPTEVLRPRRLIDAVQVGAKLHLHPRSVFRLADAGRIPQGVKVGASRRWDETDLDAWITAGCPRPNKGGRS